MDWKMSGFDGKLLSKRDFIPRRNPVMTKDDTLSSVKSAGEILAGALKDANSVIFMEGHVPNVMAGMKVYGLDTPRATREDIENFVRASSNRQVVEKLNLISQKSREDYTRFGQWDIITYSITLSGEYAYRGTYKMSSNGAELVIRRIPKHTPLGYSDDAVSSGKSSEAESPASKLLEL
jgi:hypothetical protein